MTAERIDEHFHGDRTYPRAHCWPGCRKWSMPCPACHHPDHDPGSCPECPRCELHVDEALIWVSRVAREDYDEFVASIEREAIEDATKRLIIAFRRWYVERHGAAPAVDVFRDILLKAVP